MFQTPYPELAEIVRHFQEDFSLTWLDMGAGYGRLGFVLSLLRPQDQFVGLEFVSARVRHAREVIAHQAITNARMLEADLTAKLDECIPEFDVGFLFDFGKPLQISRLLNFLRERSQMRAMAGIGRGRATRHLIENEHPWMSQVETPLQTAHYSPYRSGVQSAGRQTQETTGHSK